jgi:hypothetical protein
MLRFGVRGAVVASVLLAAGVVQAHVGDAASVGPEQRFLGLVDGNHTNAVVYVFCPGPTFPGQTGSAIGGQHVAALRLPSSAASGGGSTGSAATHLVVRFSDDPSMSVNLYAYGVAKPLPSDLEVPCSGEGKVRFAPVPTGSGATTDTVTVTYENIGVRAAP